MDVRNSEGDLIDRHEALRQSQRAYTHRLMTIMPNQQTLPPAEFHGYLLRGMDRHPLIRADAADYAYWSIPSEPPSYAVVLWSTRDISLLLTPEEQYDWRKDMRIAFEDERPRSEINLEVFTECSHLLDMRDPDDERESE